MVAQETVRGHKIDIFTAVRTHTNALAVLVELQVHFDPRTLLVARRPSLDVFVESREDGHRSIGVCTRALGGVAVAEAGSAPETVVQIQVKEAWLAVPAVRAFYVILAHADPILRVAGRRIVQGAGRVTIAWGATVVSEIVEVGIAAVALLPGHAWLALTLSLAVALQ